MSGFSFTSNVEQLIAKLMSKVTGMPQFDDALKQRIATAVIERIPTNMHWQNPTGALAGSFSYDGHSEIGSSLPYARRREFGFSGRTDSLGRTYTNDPGGFYMRDTLASLDDVIDGAYTAAATEYFG